MLDRLPVNARSVRQQAFESHAWVPFHFVSNNGIVPVQGQTALLESAVNHTTIALMRMTSQRS